MKTRTKVAKRPQEERYRRALIYIRQVLGSGAGRCKINKCDGCTFEQAEASETARRALGWKKPKKIKTHATPRA